MERICSLIGVCVTILSLALGWRVLNWVYLRPKKMEEFMRKQGLKGTSYKLLYGDKKEVTKMTIEAMSKPMNFSHDIVPRVLPFYHKYTNAYGKNFFAWHGPIPMVYITEPDLIKEILTKNYTFQKPTALTGNPLSKLLGTGVGFYDGDKWAKHRKIINPAFHLEKLKCMMSAFYLSCNDMVRKWEEVLLEKGSCELDVWPYIETFSSDVISRTAFGSSYEEGRRIFELQNELGDLVLQDLQSVYIPGSRFLPTKNNNKMKEIDKEVQASTRAIIDKRMQSMKVGEATYDDLLGILLESNLKEIQLQGNKKYGMTINEVIEECKIFYIAGHHNTASLLSWTIILLSKYPSWQTNARAEVLNAFGNSKPEFNGLNHLKIVNMIFQEVLRLYTPGISLTRMIHEQTKVGEISLPAGSILSLPILQLHHENEIWGPDANEFKPERFAEGVSKVTKGHVSFFPWGWGPRICVGQNFAMLEVKMALIMILQRFSFSFSSSYSHAPQSVLTLEPQFGAHLLMEKL